VGMCIALYLIYIAKIHKFATIWIYWLFFSYGPCKKDSKVPWRR